MPELPEVETIARTLEPLVQGRTITETVLLDARAQDGPEPLASLRGGSIAGVGRRGKLLLLHLKPDPALPVSGLAIHLKMTGRVFVYPAEIQPGPHTRAILGFSDQSRLFFDDARRFGYLRPLSPASLDAWPFWNKLGPEPLTLPPSDFAARFQGRHAAMKALLLDQTVLAGIGNIYADESLFRAGIAPATQAAALSHARLLKLHAALIEVLRESIAACGSSIRDYRTARGDAGAFQNAFRVYGRAGQPCLSCGRTLRSARVAGRATVWCPRCQK